MRIGVTTFAYRWLVDSALQGADVCSLVERCGMRGVESVQLCENIDLTGKSSGELRAVREAADRSGLALEIGGRGWTRTEIQRYLRLAHHLDARVVRLILDPPDDAERLDEAAEELKAVEGELRERDMHLAIENHFRFAPRRLAHLLEHLDSPWIGSCLDPLNSLMLLSGPEEVLRYLAPFTKCVHIKNVRVARSGNTITISGSDLGDGQLDVAEFLGEAKKFNDSCTVHIESWMECTESIEETVEAEDRYLDRAITYLRSVL